MPDNTRRSTVTCGLITLLMTFLFGGTALAQDVGIRFDQMPVGTTLITETIGSRPLRLSEAYLGRRGDFFVTEVRRRGNDGGWVIASTNFYDLRGRLVRHERTNGVQSYEPYSCHYVVGECQHTYRYPNPFRNNQETVNTSAYQSRLEENTLIVSWRLVDGKLVELPFELGPYRLRLSSQYRNRLGQERGYRFVELNVPGQ